MTADYLPHNWLNGAGLSTRWETDIVQSLSTGAESRRQVLTRPQRVQTFTVESILEGSPTARVLAALSRLVSQDSSVPLYPDVSDVSAVSSGTTLTCETDYRRFQVGYSVLVLPPAGGSYGDPQVRSISAVGSGFLTLGTSLTGSVPVGSLVFPLMAIYQEAEASLRAVSYPYASLTKESLEDVKLSLAASHPISAVSGFPTYDSLPVFDIGPDWTDPLSVRLNKDGESLSLGRDQLFLTSNTKPRLSVGFRLAGVREDHWKLLNFFDSRRGRLLPFWLPVPLPAWQPVSFASGYVDVAATFDPADVSSVVTNVAVRLKDGTLYLKAVSGIAAASGNVRFSVSEAFPVIDVTDVEYLGFAIKCRFSTDALEEFWVSGNYCISSLSVIEVVEEVDHAIDLDLNSQPGFFPVGNGVTDVDCVIYDGKHLPVGAANSNLSVAPADVDCAFDHWVATGDVASLEGVVIPATSGGCGLGTKLSGSDAQAVEPDQGTPDPTNYLIETTVAVLTYKWDAWDFEAIADKIAVK